MDTAEATRILERTKARILQIEGAIDALTIGGASSYELDTGQTKQRVTNRDLNRLEQLLASLYNRHATMQARATGDGVTHARGYG
jgi:hypothetical protein